jgi:hypothetical protein
MGRDRSLSERAVRRREEEGVIDLHAEKAATEGGLGQTAQRTETAEGKGE